MTKGRSYNKRKLLAWLKRNGACRTRVKYYKAILAKRTVEEAYNSVVRTATDKRVNYSDYSRKGIRLQDCVQQARSDLCWLYGKIGLHEHHCLNATEDAEIPTYREFIDALEYIVKHGWQR